MPKMQLKRFGIFSSAKMTGIVYAALGLLIGVIYGLVVMVVGGAMLAGGGRDAGAAGAGSIVVGLLIMIGIPIFYGILGFIFGALGALIYNVASGFVGGLELELENAETEYAAPPSPQWGAQYTPGQQQYPYS